MKYIVKKKEKILKILIIQNSKETKKISNLFKNS